MCCRYYMEMSPELPGKTVEKWIKPDSKPNEIIKEAMTDMVFEISNAS